MYTVFYNIWIRAQGAIASYESESFWNSKMPY